MVGSGSLINCLNIQALGSGEPIGSIEDPSRSNKVMGIDSFNFVWAEAVVTAGGGYLDVGVANATGQGFTVPVDCTLTWVTYQTGNNAGNARMFDLHLNASLMAGGSNFISISGSPMGFEASARTDCNFDFSVGDNISIFAEPGGGLNNDGVVTVWMRTRF